MRKILRDHQQPSRNALRNLPVEEIKLVRGGDGQGDDTDVRGSIVDTGRNVRRH
ncbi:MAG TPA: hypothetical protein VKU60_02925 [Chloroflexota bacterium]|nr:hypothetical protein [Chloroflexota bacterium]